MNKSGSSWLKFGLFTVGLGQSFVFVIVPPLARELGLSEVQTSSIFAFSAIGWALTSAAWGRQMVSATEIGQVECIRQPEQMPVKYPFQFYKI